MPSKRTFITSPTKFHNDIVLLSDDARRASAQALRKEIPDDVWDAVKATAGLYQLMATAKAVPTRLFVKRLTTLRKQLAAFKALVSTEPLAQMPAQKYGSKGENEAARASQETLERIHELYFSSTKSKLPLSYDIMIPVLEQSIDALGAVSDWLIHEHSREDPPGYNENFLFQMYVLQLSDIMEMSGLPYKATNATDKVSPFVAFVWELQKFLPKECRFSKSLTGLPKAIGRARRGFGKPRFNWKLLATSSAKRSRRSI